MSPTTPSKLSVKDEIRWEEASVPADNVMLEGSFKLTLETNGILLRMHVCRIAYSISRTLLYVIRAS